MSAALIAALTEALDLIRESARQAWVVCGHPKTEEGFLLAWEENDPEQFKAWARLVDFRDEAKKAAKWSRSALPCPASLWR